MKKTLSMITLAVLTIGLLGSCTKINERLDSLEKKVDGIENEEIASIESQVESIESSISDLKSIRDKVQAMSDPATGLSKRIEDLKTFVNDELSRHATEDWAKATFATMAEYEKTCDTVAKIALKVEGFDSSLKACTDSLKGWVNGKFGGYYDIATIDAKLAELQAQVDGVDSLSAELAKTREEIDTAKSAIRAEYRAAITSAIKTSEGKLTQALQDSIDNVNATIGTLTGRVGILETKVEALKGRVDSLENMIQTVTIVPAYSDGSVKVEDDTLFIDCIISPAEAVKTLDPADFTILLNKVLTKAVTLDTVPTDSIKFFKTYKETGTVSIKAYIKKTLAELVDKSLSVAVNVKKDKSDYTTEFVKINIPISISLDKHSIYLEKAATERDSQLVVTVKGTNKGVEWTSTEHCTSVTDIGKVIINPNAMGKDTIVVTTVEGAKSDTCFVFVGCVEIAGLKWATMNLGATTVAGSYTTCYGDLYQWGSVETLYTGFPWTSATTGSFAWKEGKSSGFVTDNREYNGNDATLPDANDVVKQKMGNGWRMPTSQEFKDLADACDGSSGYNTSIKPGKDTQVGQGIYWCNNYDGVAGCLFCDGTNKLFFPAAGYGLGTSLSSAGSFGGYWSSSLYTSDPSYAYDLDFDSSSVNPQGYSSRYGGFSVRPVAD